MTCDGYDVAVYRAQSGQWSWRLSHRGDTIAGGAGYESEGDAWADVSEDVQQRIDGASCECLDLLPARGGE